MLLAGCVVCPTGLLPAVKDAVRAAVEEMGGTFHEDSEDSEGTLDDEQNLVDLNQHITHLVAVSVGSAKYTVSSPRTHPASDPKSSALPICLSLLLLLCLSHSPCLCRARPPRTTA